MVTINSIEVTEQDISSLVTKLRRWAINIIDWSQFDKFEFQGFNPETTVASFISASKKMKLADGVLEKDIITLVGIGIMKGNITPKNKKRMSEEGVKAFDELAARYGISSSPKAKSASTITIPRTVAAYAGLAVRMVVKMGPKKYPGKSFNSSFLPSFVQLSCFPSVVPANLPENVKEFLLVCNLCYSMDLTITVQGLKDMKEIEKLIDDQRKFVDLAHASAIPSESSRRGLMFELKVETFYKQLAEVASHYKLFKTDYAIPSLSDFSSAFVEQYKLLPSAVPPTVTPPTAPSTVLDD